MNQAALTPNSELKPNTVCVCVFFTSRPIYAHITLVASPSLTSSGADDYATKCGMLSDMLDVLDMEGVRTGGLLCGRDKRVHSSGNAGFGSLLG